MEKAIFSLLSEAEWADRLGFGSPQDLPLPTDGAGEALYGEAYGLQEATYGTLGAVGGEHASWAHGLMDAGKGLGAPHLRLFLGSEGIEVDDIDVLGQRSGEEIAAALLDGEVGRDGCGLLPRSGMDSGEELCIDKRLVAQALDQLWLYGVFLQTDVVHGALSRGGHGGDGSIETSTKAYLKQSQGTTRSVPGGIQVGTVAIDVQCLSIGTLHRVVVLVKCRHKERGGAVVGMLDLEVGHGVDY